MRFLHRLLGPPKGVNGPTGLVDGRLRPCQLDTNCVRTEGDAAAAMRYLDATEARRRLDVILASVSRLRVVERRDDYVHAEVRSRLWGFVDDLEFRFDDAAGLLYARSAARLGRSDLGVNRQRLDRLRKDWDAAA